MDLEGKCPSRAPTAFARKRTSQNSSPTPETSPALSPLSQRIRPGLQFRHLTAWSIEAVSIRESRRHCGTRSSQRSSRSVPHREGSCPSRRSWPARSRRIAGGDVGSVFSVHPRCCSIAHSPSGRWPARLVQAEARAQRFQVSLRAQLVALRAVVLERREAADRYRATVTQNADVLERIAQVSYDAGERGILELLDAYRTGASVRTRAATLETAVRGRDRIGVRQRLGDSVMTTRFVLTLLMLAALTGCRASDSSSSAAPEEHTLDVTSWTDSSSSSWSTRLSSRKDRQVCRAPHAPCRFQRAECGAPFDRTDAGVRRISNHTGRIGSGAPRGIPRRRTAAASRTIPMGPCGQRSS